MKFDKARGIWKDLETAVLQTFEEDEPEDDVPEHEPIIPDNKPKLKGRCVLSIKIEDELEFEIFEPREDKKASIKASLRMQRIRQLDRSIGESLKRLYDYRCQVTGERIGKAYGSECIVEAHHIDYFTQSLNNDTQNIIILSPTFHRIVHRYNPRFNREGLCFEFENGVREAIRLDRHLKKM